MTVKQDHMSIRFRRLWQSHVYVEYTVLTKTVLTSSSTSASASASSEGEWDNGLKGGGGSDKDGTGSLGGGGGGGGGGDVFSGMREGGRGDGGDKGGRDARPPQSKNRGHYHPHGTPHGHLEGKAREAKESRRLSSKKSSVVGTCGVSLLLLSIGIESRSLHSCLSEDV